MGRDFERSADRQRPLEQEPESPGDAPPFRRGDRNQAAEAALNIARRLVGDTMLYGSALAVSRAITFLLLPFYTRFLGVVEFGAFDLVMLFQPRALRAGESRTRFERGAGCAYRKLCPAVLMVQATEDRCRSETPGPFDGAGEGSVFLQR